MMRNIQADVIHLPPTVRPRSQASLDGKPGRTRNRFFVCARWSSSCYPSPKPTVCTWKIGLPRRKVISVWETILWAVCCVGSLLFLLVKHSCDETAGDMCKYLDDLCRRYSFVSFETMDANEKAPSWKSDLSKTSRSFNGTPPVR